MIYNPNAQESERKGRNIFKTLADQIGWQVDFTDAEFCDIDVHIKCTSKDGRNIQAAGEIKNRDASAIKYPTHIIEIHKIKALLADNKNTAMFINIFGDDIFIYNVVELAKMIKHGDIKPYNKYGIDAVAKAVDITRYGYKAKAVKIRTDEGRINGLELTIIK